MVWWGGVGVAATLLADLANRWAPASSIDEPCTTDESAIFVMASPYQGPIRVPATRGGVLRGANEPVYCCRGIGRHPRGARLQGSNHVLHLRRYVGCPCR